MAYTYEDGYILTGKFDFPNLYCIQTERTKSYISALFYQNSSKLRYLSFQTLIESWIHIELHRSSRLTFHTSSETSKDTTNLMSINLEGNCQVEPFVNLSLDKEESKYLTTLCKMIKGWDLIIDADTNIKADCSKIEINRYVD